MTTVFGKILRGEIPAKKVYEDDRVLAFDDVAPQAPVHVLIIPKIDTLSSIDDMKDEHEALVGHIMATASKVAKLKGLAAYRVVMNNGADAGQSVFHMHLHVLGGRPMSWPPG